jgi:hypothetical protein
VQRIAWAFLEFEESTKLWRVLTALRGPDDQDREAKTACMSWIRREVAGQTAYDFTMPFSRLDSEENAKIRRDMKLSLQAHMQ